MDIFYCPVEIDGTLYSARMVVKNLKEGAHQLDEFILYNVNAKKEKTQTNGGANSNNRGVKPSPTESFNGCKVKEIIHSNQTNDLKILGITQGTTKFKLDEDAPVFLSNAAEAVKGIKQEKAPASQWLAMLEKNGGLKAGEDKWLGLRAWLGEQAVDALAGKRDKNITKDEILDYIAKNDIRIEEVKYAQFPEGGVDIEEEVLNLWKHATGNNYDKAEQVEVALEEKYGADVRDAIIVWYDGGVRVKNQDVYDKIFGGEEKTSNSTRLEYTTDGLKNKKEIALTVPTIEPYNENDDVHFGDAGGGRAVAWVRFGDATSANADGTVAKVLVIDEVQSKRHQDGKKKGYANQQERDAAKKHFDEVREKILANHDGDFSAATEEELKEFNAASDRINKADDALDYGVPDAPFDKNWHELAMKRMLRYAAENGYDKVAWTTGAQQAERYGLRSVGDKLTITRSSKGLYHVDLYKNNEHVVTKSDVSAEELPELIGKELAERVLSEVADSRYGQTTISGRDLSVGGEGMKGFYDNMLPSFMNKYGKKWGVKVGEVELDLPNDGDRKMWSVDVNDAMKADVMRGQKKFKVHDESNNNVVKRIRKNLSTRQHSFSYDETRELIVSNNRFNRELELHEKGIIKDNHIYNLGKTGSLLQSYGFPNVDIEMHGRVVGTKASDEYENNHPFEKSEVEDLVFAINSPIAIFKSETQGENSRVILLDIKHGDKNFIASVLLNFEASNGRIVVNKISGLYPKDNANVLKRWLNDKDLVIYKNEIKAAELLNQQQSNSADVIKQASNLDSAGKVTTSSATDQTNGGEILPGEKSPGTGADKEYNSAVESGDVEKQNELVKAAAKAKMPETKVVDENGEPRRMYHGSDKKRGEITEFEMNDGSMGKGAYFTSSYEEACEYVREKFGVTKDEMDDEACEPYIGEYFLNVTDEKQITHSRFNPNGDIEVIATSPEQIKSADPITYDDEGNVIPLSKRFDSKNKNIKFKAEGPEADASGTGATEEQLRARQPMGPKDILARHFANMENKLDNVHREEDMQRYTNLIVNDMKETLAKLKQRHDAGQEYLFQRNVEGAKMNIERGMKRLVWKSAQMEASWRKSVQEEMERFVSNIITGMGGADQTTVREIMRNLSHTQRVKNMDDVRLIAHNIFDAVLRGRERKLKETIDGQLKLRGTGTSKNGGNAMKEVDERHQKTIEGLRKRIDAKMEAPELEREKEDINKEISAIGKLPEEMNEAEKERYSELERKMNEIALYERYKEAVDAYDAELRGLYDDLSKAKTQSARAAIRESIIESEAGKVKAMNDFIII